jgi:hypothetical protein
MHATAERPDSLDEHHATVLRLPARRAKMLGFAVSPIATPPSITDRNGLDRSTRPGCEGDAQSDVAGDVSG